MTVLDLSSNDLSTLDPVCFKANGVTGVILGVYSPADAPNTMRKAAQACRDAGVAVLGFYGLIYFGDAYGETRDIAWALELGKEFGCPVWLDCETDANKNGWQSPTPTPEERVAAIHRAVKIVTDAGLSVGIYTGGWWWPSATGNSTDFADLPLWHSQYADNAGTYSEVREVSYGGWSKVAIHQWTSTRELCGRVRDHNTVFEEDEVLPISFRVLTAVAWGDGQRMLATYAALRQAGFLADNGVDQGDDLNAYMVKRGQLAELAVADTAEAAYEVIK